jgi:hypothetical protein
MEPENPLRCSQRLVNGFLFCSQFSFLICIPLHVVYMQSGSVCEGTYSTFAHNKVGQFLSDLVNFVPVDKYIELYLGCKRTCAHCMWMSSVGNFTTFDSGRI